MLWIDTVCICLVPSSMKGLPDGASVKEPACQCRRHKRYGFTPWVEKITWRRVWKPTPVFMENPTDRGAWQATVIGSQRIICNWSDLVRTHKFFARCDLCTVPPQSFHWDAVSDLVADHWIPGFNPYHLYLLRNGRYMVNCAAAAELKYKYVYIVKGGYIVAQGCPVNRAINSDVGKLGSYALFHLCWQW